MDKIELYYFTGTGNSIYIVNQLKKLIPEIIEIPVVSLLPIEGNIKPRGNTFGFCFPNHAGHLPIPMKQFIQKLDLQGNEYIFSLCNSAFSKSFASKDINSILRKNNCRLSAFINLLMPDNHTIVNKNYRIPDKEIFRRYEINVMENLAQFKDIIIQRDTYMEKDNRPAPFPFLIDKILRPLIFYLVEKHPSKVLKGALYVDSKCTGCSICEKVCPASRISICDGRPFFDSNKTCFGCYACLNYCPAEALQGGSKWYNGRSYTTENGRYPHPYASAKEIEKQKQYVSIADER